MTGNIRLELKSSHQVPGQKAQEMTSSAPGTCFVKNGKVHVLYEEVQEGGDAVIKNHLILSEEQMELRQKGAIRSKMLFSENKKHATDYITPYGQIPLLILTNTYEVTGLSEDAEEIRVLTNYRMESGGSNVTECKMEITVRTLEP